ncbi:MAG: SCO family protein, partial [Alphaproteobacteria bacterium]|nr:SCO family protein [Alphaproteobacteria bacterium]
MMAAANPVMAHGTGHKKTPAGSVMAGDDGDSAADTAAVNSWQPSFDLVDQRNQPRRASDFQGRFMLVFLGYTACPDVCPASLGTMKQLLNGLDRGQAA